MAAEIMQKRHTYGVFLTNAPCAAPTEARRPSVILVRQGHVYPCKQVSKCDRESAQRNKIVTTMQKLHAKRLRICRIRR